MVNLQAAGHALAPEWSRTGEHVPEPRGPVTNRSLPGEMIGPSFF